MDVAPINIFENQVIPMGLHNLSKNFRPNLTTIIKTANCKIQMDFVEVVGKHKIQKNCDNKEATFILSN